VSLRIYVEGGGDRAFTKSHCRQGFHQCFEKVIPASSFTIIASGDRRAAFEGFCIALAKHPSDYSILLVDSEAPINLGPWPHLKARVGDNWDRPLGASEDQAHFMAQCMESWFLADKAAVIAYYGAGFLRQLASR
jgi:hypothetical protein